MEVPQNSALFKYAKGSYFADSFSCEVPNKGQTALGCLSSNSEPNTRLDRCLNGDEK